MPKVLISDKLSPKVVEIFQGRGITADVSTGLTPEALKKIIGSYDGLVVRSATKVTEEILDAASLLKVIGRAGIGIDNIDISAATQRGIVVMNTPFGNAVTTAEHTIALMMCLVRDIAVADISTKTGKWAKNRFLGTEVFQKTLGIIGCGTIGSLVADRAHGFKMHVVVYDPFLSDDKAIQLGVEKVSLEILFKRSDFITVHTPLNDATRGIIDAKALAQCKAGVRLINCARGGLFVEEDLKQALESGHVAGAAIDVFVREPAYDNPLFTFDQVVCTPHLGGTSAEAQENVSSQIAIQMADFLLTGAVIHALNMPSVSIEDAPKLLPYLQLAEQIGNLAGQIIQSGLREVAIDYSGEVIELNCQSLTGSVIKGILISLLDNVNIINAPVRAQERGIAITESRHSGHGYYHALIKVTVKTDTGTHSFAGALFDGNKPRVVDIDGIEIEATLSPHMLFVRNEDKPGFIGRLGTTLGDAGINIASFHLGRISSGSNAISLVCVDMPIPLPVMAQIQAIPGVLEAQVITL